MNVHSPLSPHCRLCGCSEVRTDEVAGLEPLWLAECTRCHHRWTRPVEDAVRERAARPPRRVLSALPPVDGGASREIPTAA